MTRSVTVNSKTCEIAEPGQPLLAFLRTGLGPTGAKPGCGEGACGACTVLVDGTPVLACRVRVGELAGRSVTTIEGLADPGPCIRSSGRWPRNGPPSADTARRASRCGAVTAFTGKVDVGQDNQTLLARHAPYRRFGPRQPGPPFTGGPS